jgi:hypothetical protein
MSLEEEISQTDVIAVYFGIISTMLFKVVKILKLKALQMP